MELNDYQRDAMATCMPSCENESYMMLNLVGEVGELASKMAKLIRKGHAVVRDNKFTPVRMSAEDFTDMRAEAGDVLWQLSGFCTVMGWDLETVAAENLAKLASRKARGVIDGSGDNR